MKNGTQKESANTLQEANETVWTREEERALFARYAAGDGKARDEIICKNLRLAYYIAGSYRGRGLELEDLNQIAAMGLMTAVDKFDPTVGARFATYATLWIRQYLQRGIYNYGRSIRIPVSRMEAVNGLKREESRLSAILGRDPTDEELAKSLKKPFGEIQLLRMLTRPMESLDAPVKEGENTTKGELIEDEKQQDPGKQFFDETLHELLTNAVAILNEREQFIIELRYGLNGSDTVTYDEIAKRMNLSRERVRQLEKAALKKMRKLDGMLALSAYLD